MKVVAVYETDEYTIEAELKCLGNSILKVKVLPFNRMPEMFTKDGHQLVLAYDVESVSNNGSVSFKPTAKSQLSLVKLDKGCFIDGSGKITTPDSKGGANKQAVKIENYNQRAMRILTLDSNDNMRQDRNFKSDLIDLGYTVVFKDLGAFYDLYGITQDYIKTGMVNPSKMISCAHPVLGLLFVVADMEVSRMEADFNEFYAKAMKMDMDKAKKIGIEEVKKVAKKSQNGNLKFGREPAYLDKGAFEYHIINVTEKTITKLMNGDFKSYENMRDFYYEDRRLNNPNITILYKKIGGGDDADLYIVETIFYENV